MKFATFNIEAPVAGRGGKIIVNGEDISDRVNAFRLTSSINEITVLQLSLIKVEGTIEGEGIVQVGVDADLDKVLASFKADEIEQEALSRLSWGDGATLTSVIIELLRERVRGAES